MQEVRLYLREADTGETTQSSCLPTCSIFAIGRFFCVLVYAARHCRCAFGVPILPNCKSDPYRIGVHSGCGAESSIMMRNFLEVAGVLRRHYTVHGQQLCFCGITVALYTAIFPRLAHTRGKFRERYDRSEKSAEVSEETKEARS